MLDKDIIEQTEKWIKQVVVDCNFCPFAAKALLKKTIHYSVQSNLSEEESIAILEKEINYLNENDHLETSFIIFENCFTNFDSYLKLVNKAERWISKNKYDGIYQLASFHPDYCFEGSDDLDPANYTNRSIYPMLHLLREDSITKVLEFYKNPETIPHKNIAFAQHKGLEYMQALRLACL